MASKKKLITIIGATTVALGIGGVAFAGGFGGGGGCGFGHGRAMAHIVRVLDLTDTQEDLAMDIRHDLKKRMVQTKRESHTHLEEAVDELEKAKPDAARLHQLVDDRMAAMTKNAHYAVDRMLELQQTFTPEQRANLGERMERMHERHRKGEHRRRGWE